MEAISVIPTLMWVSWSLQSSDVNSQLGSKHCNDFLYVSVLKTVTLQSVKGEKCICHLYIVSCRIVLCLCGAYKEDCCSPDLSPEISQETCSYEM